MSFFTHQFDAVIEELSSEENKFTHTLVFLPKAIAEAEPFASHARLRIDAEVNEAPINAAVQAWRGRKYFMVARRFLKSAGLSAGDTVEVRFRIADQDEVDVPEDLQEALAKNKKIFAQWETLTPGKRRGLAYRVASAKRPATRQKRIAEVFEEIKESASAKTKRRKKS